MVTGRSAADQRVDPINVTCSRFEVTLAKSTTVVQTQGQWGHMEKFASAFGFPVALDWIAALR